MEAQLLNSNYESRSITPSTASTAVTKTTAAEETLATVPIPAWMLVGKRLNIVLSCTSANTLATVRTWRVKLGGTTVGQFTQTASASAYSAQLILCDRGTSAQRSVWVGTQVVTVSANAYTAAIATSAATTLTITAEIASVAGSETTTLEFYVVELIN